MKPWIEEALEARTLFFDAKHRPVALPAPLAPVVDTHGHLSMLAHEGASWAEMREAAAIALARAWLAGVVWTVCIVDASDDGRDPGAFLEWLSETEAEAHAEIEAALAAGLRPAFPDEALRVSLSAGVHPYHASGIEDALPALRELLSSPRCVALGECGLDYHADVDREVQREAFELQLALARELGLPLELHVRDAVGDASYEAHAEALEIVRSADVAAQGIDLHCYTLGPEPLEGWIELGCKVAFGGALTFKRSEAIRDAAAACPAEALLTETDCPYMAPEPLRGRPSEPALTLATANLLADVRAEVLGEARRDAFGSAWANARALFDRA